MAQIIAAIRGGLWVYLKVVLINPTHSIGIWTQSWIDTLRQIIAYGVEAFENAGAGEIVVGSILKNHRDEGEPEHGRTTNGDGTGKSLEFGAERKGDLVLNLGGTASRPIGKDDHLIFTEVRDGIDAGTMHFVKTQCSEDEREQQHRKSVPEGPPDKPFDHGKNCGSVGIGELMRVFIPGSQGH